MNILITGGTSTISKSLRTYLSKDYSCLTAGRKDCDVYVDLNKKLEEINFPKNIDVVIHTAASFGGNEFIEVQQALDFNVLGTLKLCEKAITNNVKHLILISSIFATLDENSIFYNSYSISKKHTEDIAKYYCKKNSLKLTILRPSQLYGNEEKFKIRQPFLYKILALAKAGDDVTIYGKKAPLRNYLFVDDLSKIIIEVVKSKITGTFQCQYPTDISYENIAISAYNHFNTKGKIVYLKDKMDIQNKVFEKDFSLYKKINYYPETSFEKGIIIIADII